MKNYLSFGGGVNSVALYLYLVEQGVDFEAVFVHHGTDWPETYDYVAGFQWWLKSRGLQPIKVLMPEVRTNDGHTFSNLYDYYDYKKLIPVTMSRMCSDRFKIKTLQKYLTPPCFSFIGFHAGESHRAKLSSVGGAENRFPLIEAEIDQQGCVDIIRGHGLPVPPKSGCYICPFMGSSEYKRLRTEEPGLICKVRSLEERVRRRRAAERKKPIFINGVPIDVYVGEHQSKLWAEDEYPPCQCGL